MLFKTIVIFMLLLILASLGSGFFFLIRHRGGDNPRLVKALTVRVALSVGLFLLLMAAYALGLLNPHGVYPTGQ